MIDDVSEKVREGGMLEDCLILELVLTTLTRKLISLPYLWILEKSKITALPHQTQNLTLAPVRI